MGPVANQMIADLFAKIKQKLKKYKEPLKSILFVFVAHLICGTISSLFRADVITEKACLVSTVIVYISMIPIYFFVKCDPQRKWLYTLVSFIAHIVFSVIFCVVLCNIFTGLDNLMIVLVELGLSISFGIIFVADIVLNLRS